MPLFPDREAQASFLKETIVKRERTGRNIIINQRLNPFKQLTHISLPGQDDWGHLHWVKCLAEQPGQNTRDITFHGCFIT